MTTDFQPAPDFVHASCLDVLSFDSPALSSSSDLRSVTFKLPASAKDGGDKLLARRVIELVYELIDLGELAKFSASGNVILVNPSPEAIALLQRAECTLERDLTESGKELSTCISDEFTDPVVYIQAETLVICAGMSFERVLARSHPVEQLMPMHWLLTVKDDSDRDIRVLASLHAKMCRNGSFLFLPTVKLSDMISLRDYLDEGADPRILDNVHVHLAPSSASGILLYRVRGDDPVPAAGFSIDLTSCSTDHVTSLKQSSRRASATPWRIPLALPNYEVSPKREDIAMPDIEVHDWPADRCFVDRAELGSKRSATHNLAFSQRPGGSAAYHFEDPVISAKRSFESSGTGSSVLTPADADVENMSDGVMHGVSLEGADGAPFDATTRILDSSIARSIYPTPPDAATAAALMSSDRSVDQTPKLIPTDEETSPEHLSVEDSPSNIPPQKERGPPPGFLGCARDDPDLDMSGAEDVTDADFGFFDASTRPEIDHRPAKESIQARSIQPEANSTPASHTEVTFPTPMELDTPRETPRVPTIEHRAVATPAFSPVTIQTHLYLKSSPEIEHTMFKPVRFDETIVQSMTKYREAGRYHLHRSELFSRKPVTLDDQMSALARTRTPRFFKKRKIDENGTLTRGSRETSISGSDSDDSSHLTLGTIEPEAATNLGYRAHAGLASNVKQVSSAVEPNPPDAEAVSDQQKAPRQGALAETHSEAAPHSLRVELWSMFEFEPKDVLSIAQMTAQQYQVSMLPAPSPDDRLHEIEICSSTAQGILRLCEGRVKTLDLADLAELTQSMAAASERSHSLSRPGPRRPTAPTASSALQHASHAYSLPPPWIRVRRGDSEWDMLSSAIDYWEAISLEPVSMTKDVAACVALTGNSAFSRATLDLIGAIGSKYESCKLGAHTFWDSSPVPTQGHDVDSSYVSAIGIDGREEDTKSVFRALRQACDQLASRLCDAKKNPGSVLVYLVDPFERRDMDALICACAQSMIKCGRVAMTPLEIKVRIVPATLVIRHANFSIPNDNTDRGSLAALARSIYDTLPLPDERCEVDEMAAAFRITTLPAVKLATSLPRKINFQLQANPPINLLQEAHVLHVAYCISVRQEWFSVAWTDHTGMHQGVKQVCLQGRQPMDVLTHVVDMTRSIMCEGFTWRVIVVKVGSMVHTERERWVTLAGPYTAVTLLDASVPSSVPIYASQLVDRTSDDEPIRPASTSTNAGHGAPTPAPTPDGTGTDPATPASPNATDTVTSLLDGGGLDMSSVDPEWQLFDLADETWAVILPVSATNTVDAIVVKRFLASGVLLKRGTSGGRAARVPLASLGIDIVADVPPKPLPRQEKLWLSARSAEGVLREVLTWYRSLALLSKIRHVRGSEQGHVPWHIATVINGAEVLDGFFGPIRA